MPLSHPELRRIRAHARHNPAFWASAICRYAELHTDTDRPLHEMLGVSAIALDRLALVLLPRPDHEQGDLEQAAAVGVPVEMLRRILHKIE